MVYHTRQWYYIVPSAIAASALAGAIYLWGEKTYGKYKPHTLSPCWKLATFRKWWEWPREAAPDDPVVLNPMRCFLRDSSVLGNALGKFNASYTSINCQLSRFGTVHIMGLK